MDSKDVLAPDEEKARYATHNNSHEDLGYRRFLSQLIEPLMSFINTDQLGLDFGCGPGPTISVMLSEKNINCENYDPYFCNQIELLANTYDFISCTEAIEHFYTPKKELDLINSILIKNGHVGFMTKIYNENIWPDFSDWYYIKDNTHVSLFQNQTFEFIAKTYNWRILEITDQVIIFKKL